MKLEIYRSPKNRLWYFRIKARNGKVIAQGEGYQRVGKVHKVLNVLFAKCFDLTLPAQLAKLKCRP